MVQLTSVESPVHSTRSSNQSAAPNPMNVYVPGPTSAMVLLILTESCNVVSEKSSTPLPDARKGNVPDPPTGTTLIVNVPSVTSSNRHVAASPGARSIVATRLAKSTLVLAPVQVIP